MYMKTIDRANAQTNSHERPLELPPAPGNARRVAGGQVHRRPPRPAAPRGGRPARTRAPPTPAGGPPAAGRAGRSARRSAPRSTRATLPSCDDAAVLPAGRTAARSPRDRRGPPPAAGAGPCTPRCSPGSRNRETSSSPPTISRTAVPTRSGSTRRSAARARSIWTRSSGLSSFSVVSASRSPRDSWRSRSALRVRRQRLAGPAPEDEVDVEAAAPDVEAADVPDGDAQIAVLAQSAPAPPASPPSGTGCPGTRPRGPEPQVLLQQPGDREDALLVRGSWT